MITMSFNKEYGGDLCKSHSARSEKEFCRVCPSKLNKKELENVYFTLLENNLDLKTTINGQREQIKILSTKVQRLNTLQKTYLGKEPKDCCGSKAVIDEQKECIADLKRSNQCLSERVRQLNMRLCSAKQFLKRSPFQSTSHCNRCSTKNASMSALVTKRSDTNLRTTVASSQYLIKDIVSTRSADNDVIVSHEKGVQYDFCDENKCRDRIEELQQKNEELQETVMRLKEDHSIAVSQLEREVGVLRAESVRVRSERALVEERAAQARAQGDENARRANDASLRCDELSVELAIEKRKVMELETRLKAADMSSRIANAIETHLANVKLAAPSPQYKPKAAVRTKLSYTATSDETFRHSDDSGYTEANKSQEYDNTKASTYINQVLLEKIADLQNQVNNLKDFKNDYNKPQDYLNVPQDKVRKDEIRVQNMPTDRQKMDENIASESSESVITERKPKSDNSPAEQSQSNGKTKIETINQATALENNTVALKEFVSSNKLDNRNNRKTIIDDALSINKESFNSRSKDNKGERENVFGNRKLSLQSSRESTKTSNLIKTGSLDENRINPDNFTKDKNATLDITHNDTKNILDVQSNTDGVANDNDNANIKDNSQDKENDVKTNLHEANIKKTSDERIEERKKMSSDSSKGTYSIHRNENIVNAEAKTKDEKVKRKKQNENQLYGYSKDLSPDVKHVLYSNKVKDRKYKGRKCSTPNDSRTYVKARDVSPDSTECEISSMSDLPSERDERNISCRSPGEERPTTTESRVTTTTDYGSLSEGELPWLRDTTVLSAGEIRSPHTTVRSHSFPVDQSQRMEETLAAVEQELARCTSLLRVHTLRAD